MRVNATARTAIKGGALQDTSGAPFFFFSGAIGLAVQRIGTSQNLTLSR